MNRLVVQWGAFLLSTAAVLSVAVAIQTFAEVGRSRIDLTPGSRLSLSEYGRSVVEQLESPLQIDFYYRQGERLRARDLLDLLVNASSQVQYELIDIDRNPLRARQNGVDRFDRAVLFYDGRERVTSAGDEEALVGGIADIVQEKRPVLYFLRDHGERSTRVGHDDQLGRAGQLLRTEGYELRPLSLLNGGGVPDDAAAVVIAGPMTDLVEREIEMLDASLRKGGAALVLVDPLELPHLERWVAGRGLKLADDVVIDQANRVYGSDGTNALVPMFRDHPVTRSLTAPAVLGRGRSVSTSVGDDGAPDAAVQVVARTAKESFAAAGAARTKRGAVAFDESTDRSGPVGVMGVSIVDGGGRLVVIGDADFASDDFITLLGNKDLLVNVVGWLTEREATGARPKSEASGSSPLSPLFVSESLARTIFWLAVIVQPTVVLVAGIFVVVRRRRRS